MNTAIYISTLILGLGSSLHCLGMCGPMVLAVPFNSSRYKGWDLVLYMLSKAVAYAVMGAIFGLIGMGVMMVEWQQVLSIITGVLIIVLALFPAMKTKKTFSPFFKLTTRLFTRVVTDRKWYHIPLLGFFNGWLPCGMVYIALAAALATGHPLEGATAMFLFGIGTAPILIATVVLKNRLSFKYRQMFSTYGWMISAAVGVLLILRGLDLGIPYISPEFGAQNQVESCCH